VRVLHGQVHNIRWDICNPPRAAPGFWVSSSVLPLSQSPVPPSPLPCVCPARESIAHHQTVLDNALLLQAIAGADGIDDRQQAGCPFPSDVPDYPALAKQGVKGLKIGILSEGLDRPLADKRVSELVIKAAEALRELGAEVEEVSVPFHKEAPDVWAVSGLSGFGLSTRLSARN
jgi:hypothetical protein